MVKMAIAFVILVVLGIIFFIKQTKWVGLAFILFMVEIFGFAIYCSNDIAETKSEFRASIKIDNISYEAGTNSEGEEGYYFTLTVANNAGYVQVVEIECYTDKNAFVEMEPVSVFDSIGEDSSWYYQIIENREMPPGTQVTLTYFIKQEVLETVEGKKLIFGDNYGEKTMTVLMNEL